MNEATASRLMGEAKYRLAEAQGIGTYFWQGYMQGVRRAWHGEGFDEEKHAAFTGTPEEEIFDDARLMRVRGYKAGLAGEAPKVLAERLKNGR